VGVRRVGGGAGPVDLRVANVAREQRGLITWHQLLEAGVSSSAASRRIASGRLHRVHPGVFLVGHPVAPPLALELAALLVSGPGSVLSHDTAARLWGLRSAGLAGAIDVTVVGRCPSRRPGVRAHRTVRLDRADLRHRHGLALTSPARTIVDLAARVSPRELERVLADAAGRRLASGAEVRAAFARAPRRRGAPALCVLLAATPKLTRSEAERDFLGLVRSARLPEPQTNVRLGRFEVDCLWRAQCLVVEIDGFTYHSGARAYDRDRVRDDELEAAGYRVRRVTYSQIRDDPHATVARVARALAAPERAKLADDAPRGT
jgi:very-short-patch-repair endonuclease